MRVNQTGSNSVQNADASSSAKKTGRAGKAEGAQKTGGASQAAAAGDVNSDISSKGKEFAKAKAVAAETPDVREEKIAELKRRIAAGKYKVDADAVAGKMVDEHLKTGIG